MIEAQALTRSYRKGPVIIEALKAVTFDVREGEFVAIMGRSGSGKSTLLNILGLLDRPDGGSYRLHGVDLSRAGDDEASAARNRKIGFVFQQFHLLERVSALRNVMLPLLYSDDDADDGAARARRALETVGLSQRADHVPGELSGGEQHRVAIARALINDPALILADEPTGNLDAESSTAILDLLRRLADSGRTIVLVTHDRDVAARADRILVLEDGRIAAGGPETSDRSGDRAIGRPQGADVI
jgi:putative ABC transport system ATP-binding protein